MRSVRGVSHTCADPNNVSDKKPSVGSDRSELTVPAASGSDIAHAIVKAVLASVPVAGGALAELMQLFIGPAVDKRREAWMRRVAAKLTTLLANGLHADRLQHDDRFISAVLQTTLIAQRTHSEEKLEALNNALWNIVTTQTPDEALESIFLGYVDSFTEWHIRILRLYQQPSVNAAMIELYQIVETAYPELKGRPEIYDTVWQDLLQKGLVNMSSLHGSIGQMTSITGRRSTALGDRFLQFVSDPAPRSE